LIGRAEAERLLALSRQTDFLGPDAPAWVARLEPEKADLVDATRLLAREGEGDAAAELAANVWRLWLADGDLVGGRALLAAALDTPERQPSRARALALYGDGLLAFREGAMTDSAERNREALADSRKLGDRETEALALVGLSRVALRAGDYARVRELAGDARALTAELEPFATVAPLHLLAAGTRLAGELDAAVGLYSESLELSRRLGDRRMEAIELHNIGHVEVHRGNLAEAERCFSGCAALRDERDPYERAMTYLNGAALAEARRDRQRAAALLDATEAELAGNGVVLDPDDAFEVEWLRRQVTDPPP
jgi:tetratricopeptide (TPR) repeat protein